MSDKQWHEPATETIHMLDGSTAQAEVNGLWANGTCGSAFVNGKEIAVVKYEDVWHEKRERKAQHVGQNFSA
jgi:hypothetical protein